MTGDAAASRTDAPTTHVHGTTVALGAQAILLRGPSGSGKSDLALRFLADSGRFPFPEQARWLVADDQTVLTANGGRIFVSVPATIAGMLEVRGVGLVRIPASNPAPSGLVTLRLVIDLVPASALERLPDTETVTEILGCSVPCRHLAAFEPSAALKLALLLYQLDQPRLQ
jgi:HPr kinase/phosphorylase